MNESIWKWLEIEPTKDIDEIKRAYAEAAKKYHPAEHPEEFKSLRESYKTAIWYAQCDDSEEDDEYDEDEYDEEEYDEGYVFGNLESGNAENNEGGLDFSRIVQDIRLTDRQRRMLWLTREMISIVGTRRGDFTYRKVFEVLFYNWDKEPYASEITPEFIEGFIDILASANAIEKESFILIEKVLFANKEKAEYKELYSRFKATQLDNANIRVRRTAMEQKQVLACFYQYANSEVHEIPFGYMLPEGFFKSFKKVKVYPINNILLLSGNRIRYYFITDLKCRINEKTDALTITDSNDKTILKVSAHHSGYQVLLKHLASHGCKIICDKEFDIHSFIRPLDRPGKVFSAYVYRLKAFAVFVILSDLIVTFFSVMLVLGTNGSGSLLSSIAVLFAIASALICWMPIIMSIVTMVHVIVNTASMLPLIPIFRELVHDIKKGNALYMPGTQIYVFDRFVIWNNTPTCYSLNLGKLTYFSLMPPNKLGYETVLRGSTKGEFVDIKLKNYEVAKALYDVIELRRKALKERSYSDMCREKYERLSKRRFRPFLGPFLLDRNMRDTYQIVALAIPVSLIIDVYFFIDCVIAGKYINGLTYYFYSYLFVSVIFTLVALASVIPIWSFRRYSSKQLIDIGIQMIHLPAYYNKVYGVYVLRDYIVSVNNWFLRIIPFEDVVSIDRDYANGRNIIRITTRDNKNLVIGKSSMADVAVNTRNIDEILAQLEAVYKKTA